MFENKTPKVELVQPRWISEHFPRPWRIKVRLGDAMPAIWISRTLETGVKKDSTSTATADQISVIEFVQNYLIRTCSSLRVVNEWSLNLSCPRPPCPLRIQSGWTTVKVHPERVLSRSAEKVPLACHVLSVAGKLPKQLPSRLYYS